MNYDSRSTWDSGLDAGSIPARSINCGKEGPIEDGRISYHAGRRPRTKFVYYRIRKYMLFSVSMEVKITALYVV